MQQHKFVEQYYCEASMLQNQWTKPRKQHKFTL